MTRSYKQYLEKALYPIIVICGPSGVGKSTLVKKLAEINGIYELSISYTTRKLTEEEIAGKLYYHVSKFRFWLMILFGCFVEWNFYKGSHCYYGTTKSELLRIFEKGKIPALDIDINGALQIDKKIPKRYTYLLYLDIGKDEQERRLVARGRKTDTHKKIQSRLRVALREKDLLLMHSKKDPELFSSIKDYHNVDVNLYANELINILALHIKRAA